MTDSSPLPLHGIRVIDVGTRIAAPFCAGLLGEMGAEVIKVEQPGGGDFMRTIGPFVDSPEGPYSLFWAVEGRGRKGVTLDLRQAAGQDLFRRLTATADVVCENFRPGTMEKWGVGPDGCDTGLVWARISVFGQDGPYSQRPGLDRLGIGYGGLLYLTGYPDRPPVRPGVTVSDYLTGALAAEAVLAALYRRDRPVGGTGVGGVVDAPLYGSVLRILEWTIAGYDRLGIVREREGNRVPNSAPLDNYPSADGKFVCIVAGSDTNFRRLCLAMGRPELADDPQWATLAQRGARSDEINGIVASWTSQLSAAEIEAACIAYDVPVGTAYSAADIAADPHMAAREDLVVVEDPVAGPHRQQAPFPRVDGSRLAEVAPAPRLGEHNDEVWAELVGLSADELARHRAEGVI
ncbi:MAG TPA: CaiB/BaiF CoA-transferase family protein [Acidimicrobiales bacterium]|nr:CaiB/BaiF CoA-transferase family protein [Acidimicrobiales bacterium]